LFSTTKLYICKKFFRCYPLIYESGTAVFIKMRLLNQE
jgi:hypothetical protein